MSDDAAGPHRLERFVTAQDRGGTYQRAVAELRAGEKVSHWMWFVFPQVAGLGRSETARHYAISSVDEARAYLAHPVLGPRLRQCARIVAATEGRSAERIFGPVDAMKLRSSMTLFAAADEDRDEDIFRAVLVKYFNGAADEATLTRLLSRVIWRPPPLPGRRGPGAFCTLARRVVRFRLSTMNRDEAEAGRLGAGGFAFPRPLRHRLAAAILAGEGEPAGPPVPARRQQGAR